MSDVDAALETIRDAMDAIARRDEAIRELKSLGWPATRIANETGMGIDNVRRIIRDKP